MLIIMLIEKIKHVLNNQTANLEIYHTLFVNKKKINQLLIHVHIINHLMSITNVWTNVKKDISWIIQEDLMITNTCVLLHVIILIVILNIYYYQLTEDSG